MDTKPVSVLGYKHNKHHSDFLGCANYRQCAIRNLKYSDDKLVMVTKIGGVPIYYDLVPTNTDERLAAEAVLGHFVHCDIFADKGLISLQ